MISQLLTNDTVLQIMKQKTAIEICNILLAFRGSKNCRSISRSIDRSLKQVLSFVKNHLAADITCYASTEVGGMVRRALFSDGGILFSTKANSCTSLENISILSAGKFVD